MTKASYLFFLVAVIACAHSQRYFIISPNVFRLNVEETVSVQVWQTTRLELFLQDQKRSKKIGHVQKSFQPSKPGSKPEIVKMKITDQDLPKLWVEGKLYFTLVVKGNGFQKETQVLLDIRGGTVFIQTDKPIYSPKEIVKYRVIPVGLDLRPLKQKVMIEIVNPQGIRLRRERNIEAWKKGFETKEFVLGDAPAHGTWTIIAYYSNKNMANASTSFVVKEYVLPTFLVRIIPPPYIAKSDKTIPIKVISKYSYGKDVAGLIRLRLSMVVEGKEIVISDKRSRISGEEVFNIAADKLTAPKEVPSFPTGSRLKIFAAVTERATGTMERATDVTTILVKSPYTISLGKTVKYFKPALSFQVHVTVYYPNKHPARGVKLRLTAKNDQKPLSIGVGSTNEKGQAFFTINIPSSANDQTRIMVTVKTEMPEVANSESKIILEPYRSAKRNYVVVRPPAIVPKIGTDQSIKVLIPFHDGINQLSYLVVSHGSIVDQGIITRTVGVETSFRLTITADMAPTCRIVVYYERDGDIAADSVLMDVEDNYRHQVKISTNGGFYPGRNFQLTVQSQKNSLVGLVGVDQSVYYLRNKSRLTHEKVFKDIGNFDLGCGVGAGKDNKDVFDNAGLSIITHTALATTKRSQLGCPKSTSSRKRRSAGSKTPALLKKCCRGRCCIDFFRSRPLLPKNAKCNSLKNRILETCWEDFYKCCRNNFEVYGRSINVEEWIPSPDQINQDETQVTVRQFFPETWVWMQQETGEAAAIKLDLTVPDSITTWEIAALSINSENGFGLSNTLKLQSTKSVFIYIKMPYSVQRLEQLTVYAVIYNYNEMKTRANLFLRGHSSFCSIAKPGKLSPRISVIVDAKSAVAVPFTIIPLTTGKVPIEFVAFTMDASDKIIKDLLVVPEGVQRQQTISIALDPQGKLENKKKKVEPILAQKKKGNQINAFELNIPEEFVKDSQFVMVYVTGNMMGAAVEDIINEGLNKLIQLPTGCGEQTMIRLAPTVYVLRYLYSIENGVTSEIENKAYDFIRKGYNHELKWRRTDNSYSVWGMKTAASTWLTAFVNKVFCQARQYVNDDIDENIICESLAFLESIQAADGSFPEKYAVRHREMIGGVKSKLSLTAFVVISIFECKTTCAKYNKNVIAKATAFLESQISEMKSGYLMSLVTYALSMSKSPKVMEAYKKLVGMLTTVSTNDHEMMYLKDGGPALSVEATAYALLTMMMLKEADSAGPLVTWLTQHRNAKGAFYSTQDTVIALQALSEYSSKTAGGELDLSVTLTSSKDRNINRAFRVTSENALVRQQQDITGALPGKVYIDTNGKGTAQLQIVTTYNKPSSINEQCGYDIQVTTEEEVDITVNDAPDGAKIKKKTNKKNKKCRRRKKNKKGRRKNKKRCPKINPQQKDQVPSRLTVDVCARHKFANGSSMTMMDVGLLTGFKPDEGSLKALLSRDQDPKIDHYEVNDRSVVFYLGKISHEKKTCIKFQMKRAFEVGDVHAVPVKVYDYYEPADSCTAFYGPKKNSQLLKTICGNDDQCQCTQGGCAEEPTTNPKVLKKKACLASNFVFIGSVEEINDLNTEQRLAIKVKQIFKQGKLEHSIHGKLHVYKIKSCAFPNFQLKQEYLIMLQDGIKYIIDKNAFVLAWPEAGRKILKLRTALDEVKRGGVCDSLE